MARNHERRVAYKLVRDGSHVQPDTCQARDLAAPQEPFPSQTLETLGRFWRLGRHVLVLAMSRQERGWRPAWALAQTSCYTLSHCPGRGPHSPCLHRSSERLIFKGPLMHNSRKSKVPRECWRDAATGGLTGHYAKQVTWSNLLLLAAATLGQKKFQTLCFFFPNSPEMP